MHPLLSTLVNLEGAVMRRLLAVSLAPVTFVAFFVVGCQSDKGQSDRSASIWTNPYPSNTDASRTSGSNISASTTPPSTQPIR